MGSIKLSGVETELDFAHRWGSGDYVIGKPPGKVLFRIPLMNWAYDLGYREALWLAWAHCPLTLEDVTISETS